MKDLDQGILAAEAEMAANGVTTGVLAQFVSWEGGVRGRDFADGVFRAIAATDTITTLMSQLRFETHLLELYEDLPDLVEAWQIGYVVFNDHLPHERLAEGRRPKRLTGQALKAGRNPDAHFAMLMEMEARTAEVPVALDKACAELRAKGIRIGSHDDHTRLDRDIWHARGAEVSEFPETQEAAEGPGMVVMGAPNLVRGSSHKGNISALDIVMMESCEALASDYHYPSLRRAALMLEPVIGMERAWGLISAGPAKVLGLSDRGVIAQGKRADLVVLDSADRIGAAISGGRFSYLSGEVAARFLR
jgi:alpha-D-ribose 1-methylphosphonate 5-triphosphate diphosphatase